jgi:hypothetical protein
MAFKLMGPNTGRKLPQPHSQLILKAVTHGSAEKLSHRKQANHLDKNLSSNGMFHLCDPPVQLRGEVSYAM